MAVAVGLCTGGLLLGAISPATAAVGQALPNNPADNPRLAAMIHRLDHPAGSQIAKHEGRPPAGTVRPHVASTATYGMDVSGWQGNVDWQTAWNNGARFAYTKATEGTGYTNPYFAQQYNGAYDVGMIRGAYHFALPDQTGGATQADYFVDNGGGWSGDGQTLPPALDIEYNPYGATCYGLSQWSMVQWIKDFSDEVQARTGRWPTIYTANNWWSQCTGNSGDFSSTNPLWVASYSSGPGTLPYAWGVYTFWQYADSGAFPGDQNVFNGAMDRLQALANG
ncbi:hypothetical protein F0L68_20540 [Solihabitans fulvus]|uniref:lysozyme n=2 Tax=Solihabitans fulvus TaxID=1892852 RepID=A0A5B2XAN4_9PSEU|nr:hypothetical protein F0L68_20540 [Solihabitans fulvus]